jgi:hypothetical protein
VRLAHTQCSVRHQATGSSLALTAAKESKRVHQDRSCCRSERTVSAPVSAVRSASSDAGSPDAPAPAAIDSGSSHSERASPRCPSCTTRSSSKEGHQRKPKGKSGATGARPDASSKESGEAKTPQGPDHVNASHHNQAPDPQRGHTDSTQGLRPPP